MDSNNGYFIPWRNFEQIALTRAAGAVLVVHFDDAVMEPFDYTSHANLTLYRRLKGATGSWGHHQLARESDEYKYEKLGISNAFFGDGATAMTSSSAPALTAMGLSRPCRRRTGL